MKLWLWIEENLCKNCGNRWVNSYTTGENGGSCFGTELKYYSRTKREHLFCFRCMPLTLPSTEHYVPEKPKGPKGPSDEDLMV